MQGARACRRAGLDALYVFVEPPSFEGQILCIRSIDNCDHLLIIATVSAPGAVAVPEPGSLLPVAPGPLTGGRAAAELERRLRGRGTESEEAGT